ncbi:hypothetical protein EZJ43_13255 [Pedobacter changchengzhani]|uniref:Lipoprotein n=1 Tax=Pedobacter changchengzhani TaxID=2529274 RepID=A0A4V2ZZZ0_9SPHI|nr:hypothetical protein [Pedobacter changchengzhani]TDG35583.1 hypothetical protein EZJ43_13255 [Pedobacter changchengzhani]
MKLKIMLLAFAVMLFASCGPTISGKDEQSFKASKAIMEAKLSVTEKDDLEKALRVLTAKAMKEKWEKPDDVNFKGKSFDAIVMNMIDGKTFSGIVDYAEDFLKADRDKSIKEKTTEIDSLTTEKIKIAKQNKVLDNFKLTKVSISEQEWFGEKTPFLDLTFVNNMGTEILGYNVQINIYSKATGKIIASQEQGTSFKVDQALKPNAEDVWSQPLLFEAKEHSKLWATAQYPITDFSKFDLKIEAFPKTVETKKEKLVRVGGLENIDKKIKYLKTELEQLKETKGTLDELELTK